MKPEDWVIAIFGLLSMAGFAVIVIRAALRLWRWAFGSRVEATR